MRRVLGKPHFCTEYNHPAPNTYGSEAFLLLAAYAGLQDTDAIFAFAYSHRQDDWDLRRIPSFFDIDQHSTKMATLPAAAALFLRGDVSAARGQVCVPLSGEEEAAALLKQGWWRAGGAAVKGVAPESCLLHRVSVATEGMVVPSGSLPAASPPAAAFGADTGELRWELDGQGRGLVTCVTRRSAAVIGFCGGKTVALGSIRCTVGPTLQDGWAALALTCLEGDVSRGRFLVTATGYTENTGMGWKNAAKTTVGRDWGRPPSLVEGIAAELVVPSAGVSAWALDEKGARREEVPVSAAGGASTVMLGPRWRTLWYEIVVR
jgi:hypothetical protein